MTRSVQVTFDAHHPHTLARWWAALLGYEIEHHDEGITELLEQGVITDADVVHIDGHVYFADASAASDPNGSGPRLFFQRVPETKAAKNRVHLDIPVAADELEAEVERVVATGARLVGYASHPGHRWAVMADPEGNEFCLH